MPDLLFPAGGGPSFQGGGSSCSAGEMIARAQHLIDVQRPYDGFPLTWHFEAQNVGDLTAIAAAALRELSSDYPPIPQ